MGRMIIVYFHISAYTKEDFDFRHKPGCNMRAQKKMCCTIFRNMYTSSGIIVVRFTAAFRMNGFPQLFMIIGCSRLCNPLRINFFFKRKGKQLPFYDPKHTVFGETCFTHFIFSYINISFHYSLSSLQKYHLSCPIFDAYGRMKKVSMNHLMVLSSCILKRPSLCAA